MKSPQITTEADEVLTLILVPSSVSLTISTFQHPYCDLVDPKAKLFMEMFLCNIYSQEWF